MRSIFTIIVWKRVAYHASWAPISSGTFWVRAKVHGRLIIIRSTDTKQSRHWRRNWCWRWIWGGRRGWFWRWIWGDLRCGTRSFWESETHLTRCAAISCGTFRIIPTIRRSIRISRTTDLPKTLHRWHWIRSVHHVHILHGRGIDTRSMWESETHRTSFAAISCRTFRISQTIRRGIRISRTANLVRTLSWRVRRSSLDRTLGDPPRRFRRRCSRRTAKLKRRHEACHSIRAPVAGGTVLVGIGTPDGGIIGR